MPEGDGERVQQWRVLFIFDRSDMFVQQRIHSGGCLGIVATDIGNGVDGGAIGEYVDSWAIPCDRWRAPCNCIIFDSLFIGRLVDLDVTESAVMDT